jgi:hypothetical protein
MDYHFLLPTPLFDMLHQAAVASVEASTGSSKETKDRGGRPAVHYSLARRPVSISDGLLFTFRLRPQARVSR